MSSFSITTTALTGIASINGNAVVTIDLSRAEYPMKSFNIFAEPGINDDNEHFSRRLSVYESNKVPGAVSLITRSGPGLRLNREQVQELRDWLTEWLAQ